MLFPCRSDAINIWVRVHVLKVAAYFFALCILCFGVPGHALADDASVFLTTDQAIEQTENMTWDVSASAQDAVSATLVPIVDEQSTNAVAYTLEFSGCGAMKDFATLNDVPWFKAYAQSIERIEVMDGVTTIGSYALALPCVTEIVCGADVAYIHTHACVNSAHLKAVDMSQSALVEIEPHAFTFVFDTDTTSIQNGAQAFVAPEDFTIGPISIFVKNSESAELIYASLPVFMKPYVAIAVLNGGLVELSAMTDGHLPMPVKDGFTFVYWTSDSGLMHPETDVWTPCSKSLRYARFVKDDVVVNPQVYTGRQGLDQTFTLLDVTRLPEKVTCDNIMFYGSDSEHYDNRFTVAFNGHERIDFAFSLTRGTNINGGDGSYYKAFTMPFISIVNDEGAVVADWNNGFGALKLFGLNIDGSFENATGAAVHASWIGVEPDTLEPGHYTLHIDGGLGANNGKSTLGKDIDFGFDVAYPVDYTFVTEPAGEGCAITGITLNTQRMIDVVIPDFIDGVPVVAIGADSLSGLSTVRSVRIPATVAKVGSGAFANMKNLERVYVLSPYNVTPVWDADVFAGTASFMLFAYDACEETRRYVETLDNVVLVSLDDGLYVNNVRYRSGEVVHIDPVNADLNVRIMKDAKDITALHAGFCTQTRVLRHDGTTAGQWQDLHGLANGDAKVVVRNISGEDIASIDVNVSGFDVDASESLELVKAPQGNGCTVLLAQDVAYERTYDETLTYFDNYVAGSHGALDMYFTIMIGGPGSAWEIGRWDWDEWTNTHLNPWISLINEMGQVVATPGNGLTWIELTDNPTVTLQVDPDVLVVGETYTLVLDKQMTGHNVAAHLLKDVCYTFTVKETCIDTVDIALSNVEHFEGKPVAPQVTATLHNAPIRMWDMLHGGVTETLRDDYQLLEGVDYTVDFENNTASGTATVIVKGIGNFAGEYQTNFEIVSEGPEVVHGGQWKSNSYGWWYERSDGTFIVDAIASINGYLYMFDSWGYMLTGWQVSDDVWYYFAPSGWAYSGWNYIHGNWYFFDDNCRMLTGLIPMGDTYSYFNGFGHMEYGWVWTNDGVHEQDAYYYFNDSGYAVKGWNYIHGNWYFFDDNCRMLTGLIRDISGYDYLFAASGDMLTGWQVYDEKDCYFDDSGAMVKNRWVGNYYLGEDGYMLRDTVTPDGWYVDKNGHCVY